MTLSMETLGYIAAFCTTSSFLPQAILTLRTQETESLSFGMYSLFTLGVFLWLLYGIEKHDFALIWANSITLILASIILSFKVWGIISSLREQRRKQKKHKP
jgi:MtN3 and saliva related transmembrane protein